jgi:TetR/AcrR family transcriptional regulator, fatty acid metabolism regulator protein
MEITSRQLDIIEAAGKILTSSGVGGLTIKNLAKEMQFSESAIYRHFSSKEEIIVAMLNYLADSIDERLSKMPPSTDPEENLKAMFREHFRFFNMHPYFVVAVFSDGLMEGSQRINKAIIEIMSVKIKHLMPVIIEGQNKGVFTSEVTASELMHIIMGTFRLQMFKWRSADFKLEIISSGDEMVKAILKLIKNKSL